MNQREIEFRAWDGKWMSNFSVGIDRLGMLCLPPIPAPGRPFKVLMQYTGLKDKNGREIFEGDLFNCIYDFDGCTEHVMEVVFKERSAAFDVKSHGQACHQSEVMKNIWDFTRKEIIGSIYENPDLLTP